MTEVSKEQAEAAMKAKAAKVTEEDLKKILDKRDEIERKFKGEGPLGRFIADVKIMFSLVRDYGNGSYREIPWTTIAGVVATLAYVLSPVDFIPDVLPVIGLVDDALIVGLCLTAIDADLQVYAEWKKRQTTTA